MNIEIKIYNFYTTTDKFKILSYIHSYFKFTNLNIKNTVVDVNHFNFFF